jgi:hypothetical protein
LLVSSFLLDFASHKLFIACRNRRTIPRTSTDQHRLCGVTTYRTRWQPPCALARSCTRCSRRCCCCCRCSCRRWESSAFARPWSVTAQCAGTGSHRLAHRRIATAARHVARHGGACVACAQCTGCACHCCPHRLASNGCLCRRHGRSRRVACDRWSVCAAVVPLSKSDDVQRARRHPRAPGPVPRRQPFSRCPLPPPAQHQLVVPRRRLLSPALWPRYPFRAYHRSRIGR